MRRVICCRSAGILQELMEIVTLEIPGSEAQAFQGCGEGKGKGVIVNCE